MPSRERGDILVSEFLIKALELIGKNFNDIISALLILLALQWFIRFDLVSLGKINRTFAILNKKIRVINAYSSDNIKKIQMMFNLRMSKHVKSAWTGFYNECSKRGERLRNPDIKEYFDVAKVVTVPAARRKADVVPGVITAIGILGAFIGIFASVIPAETAELGIQDIFDKIIDSFIIVIIAVVISIIYQLLDRNLYHKTVSRLYTFVSLIELKVSVPTGSYSIEEEEEERENQTKVICETLQSFLTPSIETISEMQLKISRMISKSQNQGVQNMLDSFIEKLNSTVHGQFESIKESTKELIDYQDTSKKIMSDIMNGMLENGTKQNEINTTIENVISNLTGYNEKVAATQEQISDSLENTEKFVTLLTEIFENNKELNEKLNEQRAFLQQESTDYLEKLNDQTQKTAAELNFQVEAIFSRFSELTTETFERLDATMNVPLDKLTGSMEEMLRIMDEQVRNISLYSKELSLEVIELNKNLGESVKEFSQQLDSGVIGVLSTFDQGLGEVSARFGNIIGDIKDSADEITKVAGELKHGGSDTGKDK